MLDEPKPNAACQSVEEDTGIVSVGGGERQVRRKAVPAFAGVGPWKNAVPDVKRLCGSGVMGQSELLRGEVGKGGSPAGRGLGCRKLLLSENRDWDSAAAPSKGERAVRSDTLTGTTRPGLVKPGGGEGESLGGSWKREKVLKTTSGQTDNRHSLIFTCFKVSPFTIPMDSGGLSLGLQGHRQQSDTQTSTRAFKTPSFAQGEHTLPVTVTIRGEGGEGSTLMRA